ncbi:MULTISPECIES: hypothetical protein [unclassified Agrobacterium]
MAQGSGVGVMLGKAILIIMLSHNSASHTNSGGAQFSVSYLQFESEKVCQLAGPVFAASQKRMAEAALVGRYVREVTVKWECL